MNRTVKTKIKRNSFNSIKNPLSREETAGTTDEEVEEIQISLEDLLSAYGTSGATALPDPQLKDYYDQLENREILWNTEVDDSLVEYIHQIVQWNKEDDEAELPVDARREIKIKINTIGGSLNAVMSMIDVCLLSKTPIATIGLGKTDSAGALLLMAGTKGHRRIIPSNECLIHDGSNYIANSTGKLFDQIEFSKKIEKRVKDFVLSRTSITSEEYDTNYRKDWWLDAEDTIRYNIADKIITDITELY